MFKNVIEVPQLFSELTNILQMRVSPSIHTQVIKCMRCCLVYTDKSIQPLYSQQFVKSYSFVLRVIKDVSSCRLVSRKEYQMEIEEKKLQQQSSEGDMELERKLLSEPLEQAHWQYVIKAENSTIPLRTAIDSQFCKSILQLIFNGGLNLFKSNGLSLLDIVSSFLSMYESEILEGHFTYCVKSLQFIDYILSQLIKLEDINRELNLQQRLLTRQEQVLEIMSKREHPFMEFYRQSWGLID